MSITYPAASDETLPIGCSLGVVEDWRRIKNDTSPGFRWIRSFAPRNKGAGSASIRASWPNEIHFMYRLFRGWLDSRVGRGSDSVSPRGRTLASKNGAARLRPMRSAPFDVDIAADGSRIAFVFGKTTMIYMIEKTGEWQWTPLNSWQLMETHFIVSVFLPIPAASLWDWRGVEFNRTR